MVTDAILGLFRLALKAVQYLLPDWDPKLDQLVAPVIAIMVQPFGWLGGLNHYLPITEGLLVLKLALVMWVASHLWSGVIWLLSKFHVLGGGSE